MDCILIHTKTTTRIASMTIFQNDIESDKYQIKTVKNRGTTKYNSFLDTMSICDEIK